MLSVNEVRKDYDGKTAIQNISLSVQRGEIHGLIGENGAGKTTLLKCLAGIYKPDQGTILYDETPIYDMPQTKQRVAYVSDTQDFISIYSVKGIVKLYQNFYDSFSKDRFDELNEIFGLSERKTVGTLSKGQKMRLAFMLAIAQKSDYLLLDEPTDGLDAKSRKQLKDILIEETEQRNLGVILSSHDLNGLEMLCDKVTMLQKGEVILQRSLDDVMNLVQKWQAIFPGNEAEMAAWNQNRESRLCFVSRVGNLTTVLTIGDREENRQKLLNAGAQELSCVQVSLEEIFLTLAEAQSEMGTYNLPTNQRGNRDEGNEKDMEA